MINTVKNDWVIMSLGEISDVQFSNVDKHIIDTETVVDLCNYIDVFKNDYINKPTSLCTN